MKETIGRLRVYFGVFGALGLVVVNYVTKWLLGLGAATLAAQTNGSDGLSLAILCVCALSQFLVYVAFVFFSFQLGKLLRDKEKLVVRTIWFSIIVSVVALGAELVVLPDPFPFLPFLCGLAVKVPLLGQVNRVGAQVRAGDTPVPAV